MSVAATIDPPVRDRAYLDTTLGSAVTAYLAWKQMGGAAERTLDDIERTLAHACMLMPDSKLAEFTEDMCVELIMSFSAGQRRKCHSHLRGFFRFWQHKDEIAKNPMEFVPRQREKSNRIISVFTDEEIERLTGLPDVKDRVLMQILFFTGIRKAEARHLRVGSVHLDSLPPFLDVTEGTKGDKPRRIALPNSPLKMTSSFAELVTLEGLNPEDHLWYSVKANRYGKKIVRCRPIGEASFHRWWQSALEEAGVKYRNPHTTRHTYATVLLRQGVRQHTVSRQLGHSSVAITDRYYSHVTTGEITAELDRAPLFS